MDRFLFEFFSVLFYINIYDIYDNFVLRVMRGLERIYFLLNINCMFCILVFSELIKLGFRSV